VLKPEPDGAGEGFEVAHREFATTGEPMVKRHTMHARLAGGL
jgi:hypothetical protein